MTEKHLYLFLGVLLFFVIYSSIPQMCKLIFRYYFQEKYFSKCADDACKKKEI